MQRFFNVVFSGVALVVLTPLLIPIVVIPRCTGEGEIFYRQQRVGLHGEHFGLLKFATMLKDSPNMGAGDITVKGDPRILPFGQFLRKTKLNELPQLINILKGDISVVGPQPMVPATLAYYPEQAQHELCLVRPGLTGIGSVFFRDEEQFLDGLEDPFPFYRDVIIPYKAALERWYVRNQSLAVYFLLIFLTAWVILCQRSTLPRKLFPHLPEPPSELAAPAA
jgi:lipopolysaccharide/colanic/teichoic acid biosynthesis glycosyltransferase